MSRRVKEEESTEINMSSLVPAPPRQNRKPNVLPLNKLLDATTLEEEPPSIANASSSSPPHEDRETNLLKKLLNTTAIDKACIASVSPSLLQSLLSEVPDPLALKLHTALMSSSIVFSMVPTGLFIKYFVRVDKGGFFHTYPDRGGPFHTLEEAQEAIDSHHAVQRKNICMDGLSDEERAVRNILYWYHDGTRKHSAEAYDSIARNSTWELLKALLDRHNEDNNLLGDRAYELKDIVRYNDCFDGKDGMYRSYSHYNLKMKTKGANANKNYNLKMKTKGANANKDYNLKMKTKGANANKDYNLKKKTKRANAKKDLYFAEVTCMRQDYEAYVLTCFCVVKPDHNGECIVCEVEMEDMKHPIDDGYNHGRPHKFLVRSSPSRRTRADAYGAELFEKLYGVRDEAWLMAEEARVRCMIEEKMEARREMIIKEGEDDATCTDMILQGAHVRLQVGTILKDATMQSKLDFKDDSWDELTPKELEARRRRELDFKEEATMRRLDYLKVEFWDELALKDLEAKRELEVDKRVDDNMIEKEKDASWHSKLEDDDERGINMLYRG